MKFIVAHTGARRGYAVPSILQKANMLERFYTGICASVGLGRAILSLPTFGLKKEERARLASRRLPENIIDKTKTFVWPNIKFYFSPNRHGSPVEAYVRNVQWQRELGRRMADYGFGNATWLHSFLDEFPTLIIAAKERGLKIVSEIYILLSADRLVRGEQQQFPGWEEPQPDYDAIARQKFGEPVLFTHTDYLLCPSQAVLDDAVNTFGFASERCRIVPYGVNEHWFQVENCAIPGRVLFVGSANLRKGIHYLAKAAEKLQARRVSCDFRIAGDVAKSIARQPACRHLNFLGRISRDKIQDEFRAADLIVLPSLAEGSAGATYEALAAGVPLVTTPEAGSVARDNIEGRIIPSRDPDALANAIAEIVEDRDKRNRMAAAARERAGDYTWERYGEGLTAALKSCASPGG